MPATATAMFAMPRLPAVTATRWPGCTRVPSSSDDSVSSTRAATSVTSGPRTDWRARKNEGRTAAIAGSYRRSLVGMLERSRPRALRRVGSRPRTGRVHRRRCRRRCVTSCGTRSERDGIMRDDPKTWLNETPSHLQSLKGADVFKAIGSDRTLGAIDDIVGAGRWSRPPTGARTSCCSRRVDRGPCRGTPGTSITTTPRRSRRVDGLKVHSMFGDVAPRAGGMTIVAGSHHLVARHFAEHPPRPERRRRRSASR